MVEYLKMPPPMTVISLFYIIVAIFYIQSFIRGGYLSGVLVSIKTTIMTNLKYLPASIVILILIILFIDLPFTKLSQQYYIYSVYKILDFISSLSEGYVIGCVLFTLFLFYKLLKKPQLAVVTTMSIISLLYSGIFNAVLKLIFNRERPGIGLHPLHFFHLFTTGSFDYSKLLYEYNSMPSGHTMAIFTVITPFFLATKNIITRIILLFFGFTIMVSRIYTIKHWASDVFVAMTLGIIIGKAVFLSNEYRLKAVDAKV